MVEIQVTGNGSPQTRVETSHALKRLFRLIQVSFQYHYVFYDAHNAPSDRTYRRSIPETKTEFKPKFWHKWKIASFQVLKKKHDSSGNVWALWCLTLGKCVRSSHRVPVGMFLYSVFCFFKIIERTFQQIFGVDGSGWWFAWLVLGSRLTLFILLPLSSISLNNNWSCFFECMIHIL